MSKIKWLFASLFVVLITVFSCFYIFTYTGREAFLSFTRLHIGKDVFHQYKIPRTIRDKLIGSDEVSLRKFPYPYNAMLAISSDIDDTTLEEFKTYHTFLNTRDATPHGTGLGLDIGDSMWLYMANDFKDPVDVHGSGVENVMTFYKGIDSTKKHNADDIIKFIRVGWIDSLHTFGDFSLNNENKTLFSRQMALDGWKTLQSINFSPKVWINHGNRSNKQNFGAHGSSRFMDYQQGDNPKSLYYNTDVTLENGIRYVWNSMDDNHFGHDYPLYRISLRDGRKVWGFYRYTDEVNVNSKNKVDWTWTPKDFYRQLTQKHLDDLIKNKEYSIVAQHFGVNTEDLFSESNIKALRMLAQYETDSKILIARTSRLLNYANVQKYLIYSKTIENGKTYININSINDPIFGDSIPKIEDIRGITFYCSDPQNVVILLNNKIIDSEEIQINPEDATGRASISIKWFKPDYTSYAS